MKKIVFILFVIVIVASSCKKDANVVITAVDVANTNTQLKGSWVFPIKILTVVDSNGKALRPSQNLAASAFNFDGVSKVDIRPDPITILHGTYTLTTKNGGFYINIVYPDKTNVNYKIISLSEQSITLASTESTLYHNGHQIVPALAVTSTTLQRRSAADATGNLVRVVVRNDSVFNVKVYIKTYLTGKTALADSVSKISKSYNFAFAAKPNDQFKVDVIGNFLKTAINAYIDGLPIQGDVLNVSSNEVVTYPTWTVVYPTTH